MKTNHLSTKLDELFLLLLPSFIIFFDFSSWTGRLVFNEFDLFIAPFALYLGFKGIQRGAIAKRYLFLGTLFLGNLLANVNYSNLLSHITEPLYTNIYYSQAYAFKIVKGFFYGFLIAIYLASTRDARINRLIDTLIKGAILGSFTLFLVILWERGFLYKLITFTSIWDIAGSFLNFATSYRVTALSSDMHTGGEAYDGLLLYLMPLTFLGTQYFKDKRLKLVSLLAVFCLSYCVMVGFTRATYFAVGIIILYLLITQRRLNEEKINLKIATTLVFLTMAAIQLFAAKGYSGLIAIYFIFLLFYFLPDLLHRLNIPMARMVTGIIALVVSIVYVVNAQSKWATDDNSIALVIVYCVFIVGACYLLSLFRGYQQLLLDKLHNIVVQLGVISVLCILFTGYQINARMETVSDDLRTRVDHWLNIAESSEGTTASFLFGNGVGSLPINYLATHPEIVEKVGTFTIKDNALILTNGHDLTFGQRVNVKPHTNYKITVKLSGYMPARIPAGVCERNLIYSSNFSPICAGGELIFDEDTDSYILDINSGNLGSGFFSFLKWPTTFVIKNRYSSDPIEIEKIQVSEQSYPNTNLLKNGHFEQGMDHWYFYNDFEHLPFHIKNIYLGFFYQIGLIGLLVLLLIMAKIIATEPMSKELRVIQHLIVAYLIGMFLFGFFGDPLDSARANILFSIMLFGGLFSFSKVSLARNRVLWVGGSLVFMLAAVAILTRLPAFYAPIKQFTQFSLDDSALGGDSLTIYKKPADLLNVGSSKNNSNISPAVREHIVSSEAEFYQALKSVLPGEHIILRSGTYKFSRRSPSIKRSGTMYEPIVIRARALGDVIFEMDLVEGLLIKGSHLQIRNIIFRGKEGNDSKIEHAIHLVGNADFVTIENNQFINFNSHIKSNGQPSKLKRLEFPDELRIKNNDFYNEWARKTKSPTTPIDVVGGDNVLIKNNFIADFAKAKKEGYWMATGAFLKGGGRGGIFDNNIVMCEWKLPHASPREVRIGLSFGNGGTGPRFCADQKCEFEHSDGVMKNNTILNCINDVGIYLNKSRNTTIENNAIRSSLGIDVRFAQSNAVIKGNIIEGRVKSREGAIISLEDNIIE